MVSIWTSPALSDLQDVYEFNLKLLGEERAYRLVTDLYEYVEGKLASRFPGDMPDLQFSNLGEDYR